MEPLAVPPPRLAPVLAADLSTSLTVSPALMTFAGLLALPADLLRDRVLAETERNPALIWEPGSPRQGADGRRDQPPRESTTGSPEDDLRSQLLCEVEPALRGVAGYLLHDVDDRGVLGRPLRAVASDVGVPLALVERAVAALRRVGPVGVCAADLGEYLALHLAALHTRVAVPQLVERLVTCHLDDLAAGRDRQAARALGVSPRAVAEAREFLRAHVVPTRPFAPPGQPRPTAEAEVLVTDDGDDLEVTVVRPAAGRLGVDPAYATLARALRDRPADGCDRAAAAAAAVQVARAHEFLRQLDERAETIRRVATYAVRHQESFVRSGRGHRPLLRLDVARALGLSESTVSRAVSDKRVRTPRGTLAFDEFFGRRQSVQGELQALVAAEERPLSDEELAAALRRRGCGVARRTVAKYRAELGIPAQRARLSASSRRLPTSGEPVA